MYSKCNKYQPSTLCIAFYIESMDFPDLDSLATKVGLSKRTVVRKIKELREYYGVGVKYINSQSGYEIDSWIGFQKDYLMTRYSELCNEG